MTEPADLSPPTDAPHLPRWVRAVALVLVVLLAGAAVWGLVSNAPRIVKAMLPRLTEDEVRQTVTTAITAERPDAFLVTGTLDVTATVRQASRQVFLPGVIDLDLGTSSATVRVPGRASYGFDVRTLRPEDVRLGEDGVVEVVVPKLSVHSVEPDLAKLEVETSRGWLRTDASVAALQTLATRNLTAALRTQAEAYVAGEAVQAKTNTARALAAMLRPALVAAGMDAPRFRFVVSPSVTVEE